MDLIKDLKYDDRGLIPVVVQDIDSGQVLMVAYSTEETLRMTVEKGEMVFFSRSRQEIWHKGATSGNTLALVSLHADCDGDTILAQVRPSGPACHTGEVSCFHRPITGDDGESPVFLGKLWSYLAKRSKADPSESYTARIVQGPIERVAQKIGEEGVETALAVVQRDVKQTVYETSDLLYHSMLGLISLGIPLGRVWQELKRRHEEDRS